MIVLAAMAGCLILGLVLAARLQKKIAVPVTTLASLMRQMATGRDYSLRIHSKAFNTETEALLLGFNQMAAEVENSFRTIEEQQQHLKQSEERFRNIVKLSPVPVIVSKASDGRLLFYNQAATHLFGVDSDNTEQFNALDFYRHPEDRQVLMQLLKDHRKFHGQELEVVRPDGTPFWISLSMTVMPFEGTQALFSAFVDITEQKNVEQVLEKNNLALEQRVMERTAELQAAKNKLQLTLDNMIDTYYRIDAGGTMQWASASVLTLLGYQASDIAGMSVRPLFVDGQSFHQLAEALELQGGTVINQQVQLKHKSGHVVWGSISAHLILDDQGIVTGVEGVLRDVTQLVQAEAQKCELESKMTHVQRLESLGILAGGIAHDFNNILAGIMGNAELAQLNVVDGMPIEHELNNILAGSVKAADLCKQMLAYSGQGVFIKSIVNISTLVKDELQLIDVSIPKNITLKLELSNTLRSVYADTTQLQQIIMNLITNAAESIGNQKQGEITIVTMILQADRKALACPFIDEEREPGTYTLLEIRDNGCGMDPSTMEKIFDPFFTTKFTGRGLGMSAVLGIVRTHEGTINISSEPGRGSRFRILLPACDGVGDNQVAVEGAVLPLHSPSRTVLVVDDELMVRNVVERLLETLDCKVILAANGQECIDIYRQHRREIDVVLLDMTMPVMGGKETLKQLREIDASLPVYICSGYSHESVADMFGEIQPSGFLQKPFSLNVLDHMFTEMNRQR